MEGPLAVKTPRSPLKRDIPNEYPVPGNSLTFLGWLSDLLKWFSDLQLGDEKVTLNHLVYNAYMRLIIQGTIPRVPPFMTRGEGFRFKAQNHSPSKLRFAKRMMVGRSSSNNTLFWSRKHDGNSCDRAPSYNQRFEQFRLLMLQEAQLYTDWLTHKQEKRWQHLQIFRMHRNISRSWLFLTCLYKNQTLPCASCLRVYHLPLSGTNHNKLITLW